MAGVKFAVTNKGVITKSLLRWQERTQIRHGAVPRLQSSLLRALGFVHITDFSLGSGIENIKRVSVLARLQ